MREGARKLFGPRDLCSIRIGVPYSAISAPFSAVSAVKAFPLPAKVKSF